MPDVKIMLDAGHYGHYNRSPCVPEYWESIMTWKLHLLLKNELEDYGIRVGTTRAEQGVDLEVYRRGLKSKGYDMFLSLHSNAVGSYTNEDVFHPIVYRLIDDYSGFADTLSKTVESVMRTGANPRTGTRLLENGKEYYGVLRGAKAAGCGRAYIVEHSFHTATRPAKWLLDERNLARLAAAEAKVIAAYFGIYEKKEDDYMIEELKERVESLEAENHALKERVETLENSQEKIYHYWDEIKKEIPWAYKPLWSLYEKGIVSGYSPSDLALSYTLIRALVCLAASLKTQGIITY